ncbi:MAG: 4-phosphoerythronate dehydrogenase [Halieaceae bacterium]|nr:4-phosphoerythronate dehydrogenase [Halieaceae bacterium]
MKILADANMAGVSQQFAELGEVQLFEGRSLRGAELDGVDVLLVRSVTRVDENLLGAHRPRFVGTATSGYDHIDRAALASRGIAFAHAPGSNADSVVDYVLSVLCQHPGQLDQLLSGAPLGIVGYGHIGRRLQQRMSRLGITCLAYDPWLDPQAFHGLSTLEQVLACPVVSLHAALTEEQPWPSRHMLSLDALQALPERALFINAARGELVATDTLLALSDLRPDIGLVLDCWENEPAIDNALLRICRFATPHIAGYSLDGKFRATRMLYDAACAALELPARTGGGLPAPLDVEAPAGLELEALLPWLVSQVYDVREDDEALRRSPLLFDQLRRDYRPRRELSALRLQQSACLDEAARSICRALGVQRC